MLLESDHWEFEHIHENLSYHDNDQDDCQVDSHFLGDSFESLGMSWRDFF